jgi:hypothetical protein
MSYLYRMVDLVRYVAPNWVLNIFQLAPGPMAKAGWSPEPGSRAGFSKAVLWRRLILRVNLQLFHVLTAIIQNDN